MSYEYNVHVQYKICKTFTKNFGRILDASMSLCV